MLARVGVRRKAIVVGFAALAFPAAASASPARHYVLKHPKREHCKAHYVRQTEKVKKPKHGYTVKVKETFCVFRAPKPGPVTPRVLTPTLAAPAKQVSEPEATPHGGAELREREEGEHREARGTLTIAGDGAMVGLLEKLAAAYGQAGLGPEIAIARPEIAIARLANGVGITAVSEGDYDIGLSASDPTVSDPAGLRFTKIAKEGFCVITSDHNPIASMTEGTVEAIFTGGLVSWSEVPGAFVAGPIDLYDYEPSALNQEAFQTIFLGESQQILAGATREVSEELLRNAVAADNAGIGFARIGKTADVNPVGLQSEPCTVETARLGLYGGKRNLWLVTKGAPVGESLAFMDWVSESATARSIIESDWLALG